ncbi:MAG: hypothetical protein IJL76_01680 [Bacilli bacterium]|nr:hypothetical protein [Bacilli bacterium]
MIKCPNCEGEMEFKPGVQEVVCQYCGSKFDPKTFKPEVKKSKEVNDLEGKSYMCTQCGARLLTFDETAITFCSYCGSQAMVEDKMIKLNKPDYVIPFKITREECIKQYKDKVKHRFFVPDYLKDDVVVDKFRGIYMPYCIYRSSYKGPVSSEGEKFDHSSGNYDYYNEYKVDCDLDINFEGISKDLRSDFYDKFSDALVFDLKGKEEYNPNYFVGYYADVADVDPDIYVDNALEEAEKEIKSAVSEQANFSKYGCSVPNIPLKNEKEKTAMFPFYFLSIRDRNKDRVYYAVVNGQTGEMVVDLPTSKPKYIMTSLALALFIFGLATLSNIMFFNVRNLLLPVTLLALLSLILISVQGSKIGKMFFHEGDEGYNYIKRDEKVKKPNLFLFLWKSIVAIIIPVVVYAMDLIEDNYNYAAVIVSLILVVLSFRDLINIHNYLVSNKLPQLNKRGGDESE